MSQTRRPSGSKRGRTQSLSRVVLVRRPHLATAATHWSRRGWRRPEGARSAPPGARPANPAGSSAALSLRTANRPRVSRWSRALGAQERQAPGRAAPGAPLRHNSTVPDYERRLHFWPRRGNYFFSAFLMALIQNRYDDLRGGVRRGAGEMRISQTSCTMLTSVKPRGPAAVIRSLDVNRFYPKTPLS